MVGNLTQTERNAALVRQFDGGDSVVDLASDFRLSPVYVAQILRQHGRQTLGRPITPGQEVRQERNRQLRERYLKGESVEQLSAAFLLQPQTIYAICRGTGRAVRPSKKSLRNQQIVEAVRQGVPVPQVAARFHLHTASIYTVCNNAGLYLTGTPMDRRKGMNAVIAQADWERVDWIRQDTEIAKLLGVTNERVRQIRTMLGRPKSPYQRMNSQTRAFARWAVDHAAQVKELTAFQVRTLSGTTLSTASVVKVLRRLDLPYAPTLARKDAFTRDLLETMVEKRADTGCWDWRGDLINGYPKMGQDYVARLVWEFDHPPVPVDQRILRRCKNRLCVNPEHLTVGSWSDVLQRPFGLTVDQIAEVRRLATEGKTEELRAFNLPPRALDKILRGVLDDRPEQPDEG